MTDKNKLLGLLTPSSHLWTLGVSPLLAGIGSLTSPLRSPRELVVEEETSRASGSLPKAIWLLGGHPRAPMLFSLSPSVLCTR